MHYFLLFSTWSAVSFALFHDLTVKYDRSTLLTEDANLSWSLNYSAKTISFAIEVNDASTLSAEKAWVGLGIGEETSGGMLGADIYTAEFDDHASDKCTVKDRYVPFVAAPLSEKPGPYPQEDKCQDDGSWNLVSCKRDKKIGRITMEVSRPLNATTIQDRAINPGEQPILVAYGETFKFHGKRASSKRVVLYNLDGSYPNRLWKADGTYSKTQELPLPPDVTSEFSIKATNYSLPVKRTTYACTAAFVPVPANETRYVVAVDPVFNFQGSNKVHHYLLYTCESNAAVREYLETKKCTGGSVVQYCNSQIYGYVLGMGRWILPENVGMPISATSNLLLLETHYDNSEGNPNIIDNSGARLYLSKNRVIEAGVLALGDRLLALKGQTVKSGTNYTSTCPSECTKKWTAPEVTVFSSSLHMHRTGKHMYTNRYAANGTFIETINSIEFWSNEHQTIERFIRPRTIKAGDMLSTTCIYDTSKRPKTKFGLETQDEMCIDFLLYYPAQRLNKGDGSLFTCGMVRGPSTLPVTFTICGKMAPSSALFINNPSFKDTVGISHTFGLKLNDTCPAPINSPSPATNTTAPKPKDCFSADALVETKARGVVVMEDLKVGDEVLVGRKPDQFSRVFMFTHRSRNILAPFISIETELGYNIRLTTGHMLYVNGLLTRAENVKLGDTVLDAEDTNRKVVRIWSTMERGLYNPQTEHGDIIVNGILCSTYTDAVVPKAAHALLAPLRMLKYAPTVFPSLIKS